ncbi:MAG: response regulator [Thermodesulfobacteriota bacterium]
MEETCIMIVEKEGIFADDLRNRLTALGYTVPCIASSDEEAIEQTEVVKPNLVLMDINPAEKQDTIQTAGKIRDEYKIPIIFLGSRTEEMKLRTTETTESYSFLVKSAKDSELQLSIEMGLYRHELELNLEERTRELFTIFNSAPILMMLVDEECRVTRINRQGIESIAKDEGDVLRQLGGVVVNCINSNNPLGCGKGTPCKTCPVRTTIMRTFESGEEQRNIEGSLVLATDGDSVKKHFLISTTLLPLRSGRRVLVGLNDITDRIVSENDLERYSTCLEELVDQRTDELHKTEEALIQAQKLESIGQLAGGVAHDFNNLLMVILGYGENLRQKLPNDQALLGDLDEIIEAGKRASGLTRQLLAFSRKQSLKPRVVNLNQIIADLEKMLRRMIGEDLDLVTVPADDLWRVIADPGQIEQVIMNLAVNARDAMPHGGSLRIETANVELTEEMAENYISINAGSHVMLAISDSGCGMDEETCNRIFEPFFTTKELGKGTGLGLSTVYGIVKQSAGSIWVYSEPGQGTTFKIYLPRTTTKTELLGPKSVRPKSASGNGHILVVEDEPSLCSLFQKMLTNLGYRVTTATNGREALITVAEGGIQPDLLVTDVVMPGINGKELADNLLKIQPDLKVLYMSGYTESTKPLHGILESNCPFIQKPFSQEQLAAAVSELLNKTSGH